MNATLEQIFSEAEGRYLNDKEVKQLNLYVDSFARRVQAMQEAERVEPRWVQDVITNVWRTHPEFEQKHGYAREKCSRDVTYVLRYCVLAMLRNDTQMLTDKLLYWLRTILQSFEFSEVIDTTYRGLIDYGKEHLSRDSYRLLAPYLGLTHKILTSEREKN